MSNVIRYDSLLVRHLAAELDGRLRRRRVTALGLDPERRRAVLDLDGEALILELHPTAGTVLVGPTPPLPDPVRLARRTIVVGVEALPDERVIRLGFAAQGRAHDRPRHLMVELLANQMNLAVLDAAGRILAVLWPRTAGGRELRVGRRYEPPPPAGREGVDAPVTLEAWRARLARVPPHERARELVRGIAWTSPINAPAILGPAAETPDDDALEAAYARYRALVDAREPEPCLLQLDRRLQPYPLPLPGVEGQACGTIVECIAEAAERELGEAAATVSEALIERLRARVDRLESRRRRLAEELAGAGPEAERVRGQADLLLSQLHLVQKGMDRVELDDYAGGIVEVALDPALTPVENAKRLYEAASKRERAAERLPELVRAAEAERDRLATLLERAERGEATADEVEAAVGGAATERKGRKTAEPVLPYRTYRTTGGLEVRVGRGSRANDELTFRHASPNDIWLHARDVAGAHVVLRWPDATSNPPSRDLAEAAVLAALHSKARTSSIVAVDWTRRKYVRKPRKAPPGRVAFERAKTLFVEPDPALEKRLMPDV